MKILAVDTSSLVAAAAVVDNGTLLSEFILNHKKTHSQKLMPMIAKVLDSVELKPCDIDFYAVSTGPGSFTGLRIGVTTIKAMAYAAQKPVIGVPTLDALAYNVPVSDSFVCPIMDARNNQVYTAVYKWEKGLPANITEYMGIPVAELVQLIKGKNRKTVFVGDAVETQKDYLKSELGELCGFAPGNLLLQKASSVALLASVKAANGEVEDCFDLVPFYLRKSQAEREFEKKCGCGV